MILDEAYCEFALTLGDTQASVELLARHPNLVLLRTFSKVYGLAGMRVGYGLCGAAEVAVALDQVRQPFYLNAAAQAAAVAALGPPGRGRAPGDGDARRPHRPRRRRARDSVRGSPSPTPTSSGCGCPTPDAEADVVAGLRERGVLVRAGTSLGRAGALRVTVGTPAENERFLAALGELL